MKLHELRYNDGARADRKRVGRGEGSGFGKNAGTGHKGQNSRGRGSSKKAPGFEGGQMPLYRRIPKRGFTNVGGIKYTVINLSDLECFEDGAIVTPTEMFEAGLIKQVANGGVKVLGNGTLSKKLTVKANKFSASAEAAIVAAGGQVEAI